MFWVTVLGYMSAGKRASEGASPGHLQSESGIGDTKRLLLWLQDFFGGLGGGEDRCQFPGEGQAGRPGRSRGRHLRSWHISPGAEELKLCYLFYFLLCFPSP